MADDCVAIQLCGVRDRMALHWQEKQITGIIQYWLDVASPVQLLPRPKVEYACCRKTEVVGSGQGDVGTGLTQC